MTQEREVLRMALEALRKARRKVLTTEECHSVIMSIKEALAQPEQYAKGNWINAEDVSRNVKELDIALNGEGAASSPLLIDVLGQVQAEARRIGKPVLKALAQPEPSPECPMDSYGDGNVYYRELVRSVERIRKEMEIKSVTMRCKDYDLALPIIDTHFGRVLVGQVSTPPPRKPLTDEQKMALCKQFPDHLTFNAIHAIEASHGIKE